MRRKALTTFYIISLGLGMLSCHNDSDDSGNSIPAPVLNDFFTVYYEVTSLPMSNDFEMADSVGSIKSFALDEISGMASSYSKPNALWVEEDSGNENSIYLMDSIGSYLGSYQMSSIDNRDWEDFSISTGPDPDKHYMYLADIGDNTASIKTKYIYRFQEPAAGDSIVPFRRKIEHVDKITFHYPDGNKNAEAIIVDPVTKDIYVISKEGQAVVYVARYPQDIAMEFTLTKIGVLPISQVTSAAISPDGNEIIIKNYALALYWKKSGNEPIDILLQSTPHRTPYQPEEKGESICWSADGTGYFTTSEGIGQPIYFYKRK